jgi:hypothetical protein
MSHKTDDELADALRQCPRVGTYWTHCKGGKYIVTGAAIRESDCAPLVLYAALPKRGSDEFGCVFARPLSEWHGEVVIEGKLVPRFTAGI